MKIEEIIERVKANNGIVRGKATELTSYEDAEKNFIAIADAFLYWKGVKYDADTVREYIKILISWAYQLDGCNLNFHKGILFKGGTGRGKTMLFKVFKEFLTIDNFRYKSNGVIHPMNLRIIHAKKLSSLYQKEGYDVLEQFSNDPFLMLDDIGSEIDSSNYGNKLNVIENILDMREANNLITFATTNFEKLSDRYDDRTISRMNSLFNIIAVNHKKDYRK